MLTSALKTQSEFLDCLLDFLLRNDFFSFLFNLPEGGESLGLFVRTQRSVWKVVIRTFFTELVLERVGEDPLNPGLGIPMMLESGVARGFFRLDLKGVPRGVKEMVVEMVETVDPLRVEPGGEIVSEFTLPFQESLSLEKGLSRPLRL